MSIVDDLADAARPRQYWQARATDLEAEIARLREALGKAEGERDEARAQITDESGLGAYVTRLSMARAKDELATARAEVERLTMHLPDAANVFDTMGQRLGFLAFPGTQRSEIAKEALFRAEQFRAALRTEGGEG